MRGHRFMCREDNIMTQNFVFYSPDVERAAPDFDKNLQTVLENMNLQLGHA